MVKKTDISDCCNIPPEPPNLRRRLWWIFIITMALYLVPSPVGPGHFILTKSQADSWNDMARIATVESLTERQTMAIDQSKWGLFTGDKVMLREHFYSTKPPLLSAIGAFNYLVFRSVVKLFTGHEISYIENEDIIYPWVTFTTSVLAFALLLVFFYRALHLVDLSNSARWWLFWALAIGSLYPAYSTVLNNHTVAGAGIFISFFYVLKYRLGGVLKWWEILVAGLSVGFAGVNDFTGALPFVVLFFMLVVIRDFQLVGVNLKLIKERGYMAISAVMLGLAMLMLALKLSEGILAVSFFGLLGLGLICSVIAGVKGKWTSLVLLIGILLPVFTHLFLNSRVTGNWMPTYIQTDIYIAVPAGYFGEVLSAEEAGALYWARWKYAGTALFGIRGIFLYTPAMFIGFVSGLLLLFKRGAPLRLEALSIILAVIAGWGWVLFFAAPNFGGTSYGFRYALAAAPMMIFFCHPIFKIGVKPLWTAIFRNFVFWGAIVGLIAIPFPWGAAGYPLPRTQCSIIENLHYIIIKLQDTIFSVLNS